MCGTKLPHRDGAPLGAYRGASGDVTEKIKTASTGVGRKAAAVSVQTRILEPAVSSRALQEFEARLVQPVLPSKAALSNWQLAKMVMFGLKVIIFKRFGVK